MKRLLGDIRRADEDFHMIAEGDRVAVGVSGGKDSLMLLLALSLYSRFKTKSFSLTALTLKIGEPFDPSPIADFCRHLGVPFILEESEILHGLFDVRHEPNPCALCAYLRRGTLIRMARKSGCSKLALGHHREDALETLLMSLLRESRLHTFHPALFLPDQQLTVIRPMVYAPESEIIHTAKKFSVPVIKSPCPIDGKTERRSIRKLLDTLCEYYPDAKSSMLAALQNEEQYRLWNKPQKNDR